MSSSQALAVRGGFDRGMLLILGAAVLWGTTGTTQAFAPPGATPLAIGAVRLAVGGTALLALALTRRQLHRAGWRKTAVLALVGGIAAYQVCFFAAVARTGVAVGTVVAIGSAPMLAGLLGLLFGQQPGWRWLLATLLAVTGCTLLILTGGAVHIDATGVLLALGAGGSYAVYTMAGKELLKRQPPDAVNAVAFFGGALILAPILLFADLAWLATPRGILVAMQLGLVTVALAYMLYLRGLLTVPAATAVTLALMEPLTAAALGILVLHEPVTLPMLAGMGLILAGLAALTVRRRG